MLKRYKENRVAAQRHQIAMRAARDADGNATIFQREGGPTVEDVINLAYGSHGIRLTETEACDALAAVLAQYGRRLSDIEALQG